MQVSPRMELNASHAKKPFKYLMTPQSRQGPAIEAYTDVTPGAIVPTSAADWAAPLQYAKQLNSSRGHPMEQSTAPTPCVPLPTLLSTLPS